MRRVSFLSLVALAAILSGCDAPRTEFFMPGDADKTLAALSFKSAGASAAPAKMTVKEKTRPLWFAAQAEAGKGKPDFSFPCSPPLASGEEKTREITVETAPGFSPPSPAEKAAGFAVGGLVLSAVAALALAGFLSYGGHVKAAGFAGAGAAGSLVAAKFMSDENALLILGGFVIFSLAVWASWHFVKDRLKTGSD